MSKASSGSNNGMFGRSVYDVWLEKFGKEIADEKYVQWKLKCARPGEKNGMYGKASPCGAGNGWSGYFKNIYFRSLLELRYLKYLLDNNISFKNGEKGKYKIPYQLENGTNRTYSTDYYLLEKDIFIEIKPKGLLNTKENKLKFEAAKKLLGDRHIVLTEEDIQLFPLEEMYELYLNGDLIWDKRYIERFLKYYEKNKEK